VVNVVTEDTDILVLLMHHWKDGMADVYFRSESNKKQSKIWRIHDLVTKAGNLVTSNLLFIHAWSGCDTTSAAYGHGKTSLFKKLKESEEVRQISLKMSDVNATEQQIGRAGIRLFVIAFGGKEEDSLNKLRFLQFMQMIASKTMLDPQKLLPTEQAAYFHSLRVHLQIITWSKLSIDILHPKQ